MEISNDSARIGRAIDCAGVIAAFNGRIFCIADNAASCPACDAAGIDTAGNLRSLCDSSSCYPACIAAAFRCGHSAAEAAIFNGPLLHLPHNAADIIIAGGHTALHIQVFHSGAVDYTEQALICGGCVN